MSLELPGVGRLVEDEPAPQRLGRGALPALQHHDVGLDQVEGGRRPVHRIGGAPGCRGERRGRKHQHRVVLAQHPLCHEAEHLTDVAAGHPPTQRGEGSLGDRTVQLLRGLQQAADDLQVGVDETVAVQHGDPGDRGRRRAAHLGDEGHHLGRDGVIARGELLRLIPPQRGPLPRPGPGAAAHRVPVHEAVPGPRSRTGEGLHGERDGTADSGQRRGATDQRALRRHLAIIFARFGDQASRASAAGGTRATGAMPTAAMAPRGPLALDGPGR